MTIRDALPRTRAGSRLRTGGPKLLLRGLLVFVGLLFSTAGARAAEYYVSPTGSDANAGSLAAPFASLQKGNDVAEAGDTVWLRGGTYRLSTQIKLSKSGKSDAQRIKYWAYQQELPVFDFSAYVSTNTAADVPQILVTGNWLHLRGLEIANGAVGASGAHSNSALRSEGASNNLFELLDIHHNFGPGLFISKGTGGNLIVNCDSHDNYDKDGSQGDGQNADGFGVHYQTTGPSTIVRGCRAWFDSDDGYDLISQEVPVTIENSWAFANGTSNGGTGRPSSGNGNGFKAGSSQTGVRHVLQNDVAWKNRAAGFYANHSSGGNTWLNNTSYMNAVQYNMLASPAGDTTATIILSGALVHKLRNNVGFPNKNTNMDGVDSSFNTWDLGIAEASSDFLSTMDTGAMGPRQADGSLPAVDFMKLRAKSPLIDKGTNVSLPYLGAAPDLGAYEYGAVSSAGAGGMGNNAGSGGGGGDAAGDAGAAGNAGDSGGTASGAGGGPVSGGSAGVIAGSGSAGASTAPAGNGGSSGGADPVHVGGATAPGAAGEPSTGATADAGCSCRLVANSRHSGAAPLLALGALGLLLRKRRNRAA
ncbi:MAG: right-handed parallel beta-helix repeat-containing protein [Pseudomonadota bacterium]